MYKHVPAAKILRSFIAIVGLFAAGLVSTVKASDVAFFYALDADLKTFEESAKSAGQPVKLGSRVIHRLELNGSRIYTVKMGSGAVETAISATTLLTHFHCDLAISLGPVGALDDSLEIGRWYALGPVTPYQKGSNSPEGFHAAEPLNPLTPPTVPTLPALLNGRAPVNVASGEVFIASNERRESLRSETGASAVDMNAFGLLSACASAGVPHIGWRVVSDHANNDAGDAFRRFVHDYDGAGGRAVAAIVRALPPNQNAPESYPALRALMKKGE